jgi:hypothetical protein
MDITTELDRNRQTLMNARKNVRDPPSRLLVPVSSILSRVLSISSLPHAALGGCVFVDFGWGVRLATPNLRHLPSPPLSKLSQVGLVSGMTDQARKVLRSMTRREVKIKVCVHSFVPLAPTPVATRSRVPAPHSFAPSRSTTPSFAVCLCVCLWMRRSS